MYFVNAYQFYHLILFRIHRLAMYRIRPADWQIVFFIYKNMFSMVFIIFKPFFAKMVKNNFIYKVFTVFQKTTTYSFRF